MAFFSVTVNKLASSTPSELDEIGIIMTKATVTMLFSVLRCSSH